MILMLAFSMSCSFKLRYLSLCLLITMVIHRSEPRYVRRCEPLSVVLVNQWLLILILMTRHQLPLHLPSFYCRATYLLCSTDIPSICLSESRFNLGNLLTLHERLHNEAVFDYFVHLLLFCGGIFATGGPSQLACAFLSSLGYSA